VLLASMYFRLFRSCTMKAENDERVAATKKSQAIAISIGGPSIVGCQRGKVSDENTKERGMK
jgi:hypothetical protein